MSVKKIYLLSIIWIILFLLPIALLSQSDISVEFSFNKPDEYVCKIRNMTNFRMTITFNKEQGDIHSNLYFYVVNSNNDTIPVYYELYENPGILKVHLDPGKAYTTSYKMSYPERFVKARVIVKYSVKSPEHRGGFYEKAFNLREIRNEGYIPQVLRK